MTKRITRRNLKNGVIAFIDLLGFSARVEAISTEDELRALDDAVSFVQAEFGHKTRDELTRDSNKVIHKTVLAFSDCLVISVPVRSPLADHQGSFDVLMSELNSFALAQGTCVLRGMFLRGGVDIGAWYRRQDALISPAMIRAYRLEHDACVPMIAITPDLWTYLANHPHRRFYSDELDPIPRTFSQQNKLPNGSTQRFLNYVRICLETVEGRLIGDERARYEAADADERDRMRSETWNRACRDWARDHAQAIIKAHTGAENADVRQKYRWLARYHNKEIRRFFRREAQPLVVHLDRGN
jgi:hypothetical protein